MGGIKTVKRLSKKYSMTPEEFIEYGSILTLRDKRRNLQIERLEILARYKTGTVEELRKKIKDESVAEHPAWEDLIEIKNIESEIKEIESDIKSLQAS